MHRNISLLGEMWLQCAVPGEPNATVMAPKGAGIHTGHSQDPAGTCCRQWGTRHRGASSYGAPAGFGTFACFWGQAALGFM